jgi:hypothetical protein
VNAHVFIDNSNIFCGAQRAARTREAHIPRHAIRVYFKHLARLVEKSHRVSTRVLAGSVPPGNEQLWQHSRDAGYNTDLLRKVERDDGSFGEQAVDELLHLKIANALLDHDVPQTLVLATGDGKLSQFGTSFPLQAERALKRNWNVQVWSWTEQLSKGFRDLARRYPQRLEILTLDAHYPKVTFVASGSYEVENGRTVHVASRLVSPL